MPPAAARRARSPRARPPLGDQILVVLAGLVMASISLGIILYSTGGHIAAPIDDTYIHLQYAQQLADGHPFAYNTEDGYSSGATSFLYVLVLAAIARLGPHGDALLWAAQILNAALFAASAWLSYRLGWQVRNRLVAGLAALLFLLNAHLVWGFATAMETGLVSTLVLLNLWLLGFWILDPFAALRTSFGFWRAGSQTDPQSVIGLPASDRERREPEQKSKACPERSEWIQNPKAKIAAPALLGAMVALAWVRPEGLALVWMAAGVVAWRSAVRRGAGRRLLGVLVAAALLGLVPLLLNWVFSGTPTPNAALAKSQIYLHPQFELLEFLRSWLGIYSSYFTGIYATAGSTTTFIPFALLFVMLGGLPAAWREIGRRRPGLFTVAMAWFVGGMLVSALLEPTLRGRYQMPYYGIFDFLTAVGLYDVVRAALGRRAVGQGSAPRRIRAAVLGVAGLGVIVLAGNVITLWTALGENAMDITNQQVALGRWIARTLPPDARLAINDVGAMKFYGGRYVYDLAGLTTNATAGMGKAGDGVIAEWLRRLPADRRPDYFIIYRDWFPNLSTLPGFLTPVYTTVLPHPTIVGSTVIVATPDWAVLAGRDTPLQVPGDPAEAPATSVPLHGTGGGGAGGTFYLGHIVVEAAGAVQVRVAGVSDAARPSFDLVADESQYTTHLAPGPAGPGYTATLVPGSYRLYAGGPPAGAPAGQVAVDGARLLVPSSAPGPARREADRLDVGWPADEAAHGFVLHNAQWNIDAPSIVREAAAPGAPGGILTDSGRAITGYAEFTVATQPGRAVRIVDRHLAPVPQRVQVQVDGQDAGIWFWPAAPGWAETAFLVPAAQVTQAHTRLRLTLLPDGALTPLQVFHYWFYQ